jgi:hypothetical protein
MNNVMAMRKSKKRILFIISIASLIFILAGSLLYWDLIHKTLAVERAATRYKQSVCQPITCQSPIRAATSSSLSVSQYIMLGNIPLTGAQVGATYYGALESPKNGHYVPSNYLQGGTKNGGAYDGYDDNGEGSCGGKYTHLDGNYATWAEDDNGTILGNLPCGTKLEITYHNHTVVAEKGDTSNGGCTMPATRCSDNGHERAIDLWWQTAKALCLSEQPDILTIHAVTSGTPTTSIPAYISNTDKSTAVCQ